MNHVFLSYSHKDEEWKDRLKPHLIMLEKCDRLKYWDDRKIDTGASWYPEIQAAMEQATVAILLISANYLSSDFCVKEEIPFLLERRAKQGVLIIPILIRPCHWKAIDWLKAIQMIPRDGKSVAVDFKEDYDTIFTSVAEQIDNFKPPALVEHEEPAAPSMPTTRGKPAEKIKPIVPPAIPIYVERLPVTGAELFGRQKELQILDDAWESGEMNVISFVAWGGVGKSTLVNKWVERMAADSYRSAKRVYAWSFYSQGTGERVTSADQFISHALKFFGDPDPTQGSAWDKGKRLASLIRAEKTLLILDGLEPLQSDLRFEYGKIKDAALAVLVSELAKANHGLCVITSRVAIPEMLRYPSLVRQVDLEQISDEAGRALLRVRGVRGSDAELEGVTRGFGNHALAINLLAEYLHTIPEHPAQAALQIPDLDIPEKDGKHPRRVMEAFVAQFGEGAELELLCLLGLFDRPAAKAAIDAVITGEPIKGLTAALKKLSESDWLRLLQKLRDYKLIARESKHRPDVIDCHPLIREHFGAKLKASSEKPKAKGENPWQEAHRRLYEYYKSLPEKLYGKELPDTLEEMEPLFAAVAHGCRAGKHQEALDDIYWERIKRKYEHYSWHKLGAFGADLSALSNFYDKIWDNLNFKLTEEVKPFVLNWTGLDLRSLGRLREALGLMNIGSKNLIEKNDWKQAALSGGNLSELYLTLGEVETAVSSARQSVEFADRSGDDFVREVTRGQISDALHQAGELTEAKSFFDEAEAMQKKRQLEYRYLYSLRGFLFCNLLLSQGKVREVLERAKQTLEWAEKYSALLDRALDKLSLGRAYLLEAVSEEQRPSTLLRAQDYLNQAVAGLREAGEQRFIPLGLFARAFYCRMQNQFPQAWDDLEEAREIAERGEMKLWLVDYHLEASRLLISEFGFRNGAHTVGTFYDDDIDIVETFHETSLQNERSQQNESSQQHEPSQQRAHDHLNQAAELVQKTGYHRRDPEVELGYAGLFLAQGDQAKAREHLVRAKKLLDKMGIRCWDFEVKWLEEVIGGNSSR